MPDAVAPHADLHLAPLRTQARGAVERAWARAIDAGKLPAIADGDVLPEVEIDRPAHPEHGDLATNLALRLARPYRQSPMAIATVIAAELKAEAGDSEASSPIASADVAAPGFINLRVADRDRKSVV